MPTKPPVATNLNTSEVYGTAAVDLANIVLKDDGVASTLTVVLSLTDSAAGTFGTLSGVLLSNANTVATITGKLAEANAALAALTFTPSSGYTSTFAINVKVSDDDARPNVIIGSKLMNFVSDGDDTVRIDPLAQTVLPISGGKGSDTLVISDSPKPLKINLNAAADTVQVVGLMGKYTNFEHLNASGAGTVMTVTAHSAGSYILTGSASDKITLGAGVDYVSAGAGNDAIYAGLTAGDQVDLGAGNETFMHSDAAGARVYGGDGNDTLLYTSSLATTLTINGASSGTSYHDFETVAAGRASGNITVTVSGAITTVATGKGNDVIDVSAAESAVMINAGAGANTVTGSAFADSITLGSGVDLIAAGDGSDRIMGRLSAGDDIDLQAGDDTFAHVAIANTIVDGGDGIDTLILAAAKLTPDSLRMEIDLRANNAQQIGNEVSGAVYSNFENIEATKLRVALDVTAGENTAFIFTGKGADIIDASAAKNGVHINGNGGADNVTGSDFNDAIVYQSLSNSGEAFQAATIDAGAGIDSLVYSGTAERYFDFSGHTDQIPGESGSYRNLENLQAGSASGRITFVAGAGTSSIVTGRGVDNIDATLAAQAVSINGGAGTNTITGSQFGDTIMLGSGVDTIYAGTGDDAVVGNVSTGDQIRLGGGNDSFDYGSIRRGTLVDGGDDLDTLVYAGAARTFNFNNANNVTGEEGRYENFENLLAEAATGNLTVIASAVTTDMATGAGNDMLTGAVGSQRLQGGAGNDTLNGGADSDSYVFAASGEANGTDSIGSNFVGGAGGDVLDFSAFGSGGTFSSTVLQHDGTSDVAITYKVILLATDDGNTAAADSADKIAALIEGGGNAMSLASGGKAVIIAGDDSAATANASIYYIDDSVGANKGQIETDDISLISTLTVDIDTIVAANIDLIPGGLSYNGNRFDEAIANDGSISTIVTVTLTGGDTFAGAIGDTLGSVGNVPAGLTAVLVKASDTKATLSLAGNALSHANAQDISNLTVTFAAADFTSGNASAVSGLVKSNLAIDFDDPLPTFTVTDTSGVLTFGGTADGVITVVVDAGNVATFTRNGITATTSADLDVVSKITLEAGQTLTAATALVDGMTFDGAGTLNLLALHATLDADLSNIATTTVNAAFDDNGTFSGELGAATVNVAAGKTLTLSAAKADGKTIGGAGNSVLTDFTVTNAYVLAAISSSAGTVSIAATTSGTLHANTTLNASVTMTLDEAVTLTGTADQLHGVTLLDESATANVVVTSLGDAAFDASNFDLGGTVAYHVQTGEIMLHANTVLHAAAASATTINIAAASTLTASAAQVNGLALVASATGNVVITGADGAQAVTGTDGDDILAGGQSDDTLNGAAGADVYVFEATGELNGTDTIVLVQADDVLEFSAFLSGGSVALNSGVLDVITTTTDNELATDSVIGLDDGGTALTADDLALLFQTTENSADNVFALDNNGKAIILHGDGDGASRVATIYFVDAGLDGTGTDVTAADIIIVGVTSGNVDLSTLTAANFDLVV